MALSIILITNILEYISKFLNIHDFFCPYKRLVEGSNNIQMIAIIKTPKGFDKLIFLILTADTTLTIIKTIVFINSFDDEMTLVYQLYNLLFAYIIITEQE